MTANTFDFGVRNSIFGFGLQTKEHRLALGETLSSITITPNNWDGERTFSLAPNAGFEELRAVITGGLEYHYELTVVDGDFHWYANINPNRIGGSKGYLNVAKFSELPEDGDRKIERRIWMAGEWNWVKFPSKFVFEDPKTGRVYASFFKGSRSYKVVDVQTKFALVKGMGLNRLELSNSVVDDRLGVSLADLKHGVIEMLAAGIQVTAPVTLGGAFKDENGQPKERDNRLQKRALWLKSTIEAEGYDWAAAREQIVQDRILYSITKRAEEDTRRAAPELWEDEGQREEVKTDIEVRLGLAEETRTNIPTIKLDGSFSPITAVVAGEYRVLDGGKIKYPRVKVAMFGGQASVRQWARQGYALELIERY